MSFLARAWTREPDTEARTLTSSSAIPTPLEDALMYGEAGYIPEGNPMSLGAFYACVTLLADTIASLSVKSYRDKDGAKILVDPQPQILINSPHPDTNWFEWLWMMMESLAVTGNGFGYITGIDDVGRATGIKPIHPNSVRIELPQNWDQTKTAEPTWLISGKPVPRNRIMHIRRYPIAGCVMGMSPVEKAAADIGLGLAATRYGLRYFRDSANPSGLLTTDNELTPEQQMQTARSWMQSHQNRRRPAILSNGLKWQSVTLTPDESQFLETRSFQRSEIAMWFRIPPHMIGDTSKSTSWGTGIEQQSIGFAMYTLRPWLTCFEQALSLFIPRGQYAMFNIDGLLRGDVKTRWEAYRLGRESGVYSVNDIRAKENLPPVGPEGDIRLQPMNFAPLGYEPPPEPTAQPVRFEPSQQNSEILSDEGTE